MMIDTHCHVSPVWYLPVDDLLFQMNRAGVDRAVLVQMRGQVNNEYQMECLRRYPGRFASVVCLDEARDDAVDQLRALARQGASGVRLGCSDRSPGPDPLALWREALALNMTISCTRSGSSWVPQDVAEIAEALPELPIVLEHLGGWNRPEGEAAPYANRRALLDLARYPNVYVKIHGLGEFAERAKPVTEPFPFVRPVPPFLAMAVEKFGPARMMWGSDWPPVAAREGYINALRFTQAELAGLTVHDRALVFGGTAETLFRFG